MRQLVLSAIALFLVAVSCGEPATPSVPAEPAQTPTATATPEPPPTPTPTISPWVLWRSGHSATPVRRPVPTPTPTPVTLHGDEAKAGEIAERWVRRNPDRVTSMVADAVMESPFAENIPISRRLQYRETLGVQIRDQIGVRVVARLAEVAYHGDSLFSVTLLVQGAALGEPIGNLILVDIEVPIVATVNLDSEQVVEAMVDQDGVVVVPTDSLIQQVMPSRTQ